MTPRLLLALAAAGLLHAGPAAARFESLPPRMQEQVLDLSEACRRAGGRAGNPIQAVEALDLDGDALPDFILDESRFPCRDAPPEAACPPIGCSTFVTLSAGGRWRAALDVVGSYCIDRTATPPRFVTAQRNYLTGGGGYTLHVRYRFARGMAFQDGRGTC